MLDQCPICKSHNAVELYSENVNLSTLTFTYEFTPESQKTFRVVRCRSCSHVFCSPLPKNIYKKYEDVVDKEYLRHSKTRKLSSKSVLNIVKRYSLSGKLLDVGCATGDFLEVARDFGHSVEGLELSQWSSEIAKNKGLKIHKEPLVSLSRRNTPKYDIITMWGVIEHFQNPLQEMIYVNKLLKPGGILAVWTGNVDGLMSRILGRRWWYWQGQHVQYFTSSSLNHLGLLTGFEHIATHRYPIAATYDQVANSLSRYKFQKYLIPIIKLLFLINPIWYLLLPGEMLWLARKKTEKQINKKKC